MNTEQTAQKIAVRCGISDELALAMLRAALSGIKGIVADGGRVSLDGVGIFQKQTIKARAYVSPKTGAVLNRGERWRVGFVQADDGWL